ncbi:MAG: hypothetical protein R3F65_31390 [bacterium]
MGQVEVERRDRGEAFVHRVAVAAFDRLEAEAVAAEPVVGAAARVLALGDDVPVVAPAAARPAEAGERRAVGVGHVDVEHGARRPLAPEHERRDADRKFGRRAIVEGRAAVEADRERPEPEERGLHRASDGARVGDVVGEVGAAVDAADDEVGRARQQVVHGEVDAVGRAAVDCPAQRAAGQRAERAAEADHARDARLFAVGRDDGDLTDRGERLGERADALCVEAVVVGDQDERAGRQLHLRAAMERRGGRAEGDRGRRRTPRKRKRPRGS